MKYLSQLPNFISGAIVIFTCALSPQTFSAEITTEQAKEKVDDSSHLNRYFGQEFGSIGQLIGTDNEAAEKKTDGSHPGRQWNDPRKRGFEGSYSQSSFSD